MGVAQRGNRDFVKKREEEKKSGGKVVRSGARNKRIIGKMAL